MKKFYEKSSMGFTLMWIGIYCVGMSVFDEVSLSIGLPSSVSAVFAAAMSVFLFMWVKKNGLTVHFGLCKTSLSPLLLLPLVPLTLFNLRCGIEMQFGAAETVFFISKMLCVGFLEELIFRGFLFRAMGSTLTAAIVSGVTFGLGHIVNLVNGSGMDILENLVQIVSAVFIGILFVVIFVRGGSILPCIVSHGIFNSLSAFSAAGDSLLPIALLCLFTALYTALLLKSSPKKE